MLTVNVLFLDLIDSHRPIGSLMWAGDWSSQRDAILAKINLAYFSSFQGALCGAALAVSFKMFKHYYLKDQRNQQLQKENTDAPPEPPMAEELNSL